MELDNLLKMLLQAKIGRVSECEAALQRLRGKNADIYQEASDINVRF